MTAVYLIMGVSGSGKTTVGQALAARLNCAFYDGDDLHPPENIAKMTSGTSLTDADRYPWLARLHDLIAAHLERGETAVLACSALKKKYRDQLRSGNDGLVFVYLKGSFELIWERMVARKGHYMKADMLKSQFEALEAPSAQEAQIIDINTSVDTMLNQIIHHPTNGDSD